MTTPETTNSYEQNRQDFIAKQLEKTLTPREITIKYILSHEQERKAQAAKEEAEESERIARRSLFAVIKDRDQLQEENDQLKAAAAINEQAAALQLEAVANDRDYQKALLENERASWGKITRQLYAKLDNLTAALETAERQNQVDADNLTAVLESRYNAESIYIEKISDLMDENLSLKNKLKAIQAIVTQPQE